jgi:hypothetical protein
MSASASDESAAIRLRLEGKTLESIEAYRASFRKIPTRRAAVKQLIEHALADLVEPSAPRLRT